MEHENAKILSAKGELSDDVASSYEKLRKSYDQLYRNISSLAEALDMQPPVMPEDNHTTRVTMGEDGSSPVAAKDLNVPEPIWDDEDTKAFYESLPDLRAFVPAVLLGEAESKVNEQPSKTQESLGDMAPDLDQGQMTPLESLDAPSDAASVPEGITNENGKEKEEKQSSKEKEKTKDLDKEKTKDSETHRKGDAEKDKTKVLEGTSLDGLLQRLPGCVSRDLIDQLTVEFCYLNSKANRKKLVRALFNVPRTSLELLPYYSRMVATLSTCMKDISSVILQMLEEEFNFLINKKDQMNIETKIKNIRFIGELCKFKIAPPGLVFSCLKACLDDFTHHNIDVACNLLETCGRFLYRSPETSLRMANMLGILMRLKNVKNLDPRHSTLVENAYYLCKPPERSARVSKVRPPLHQYIRKLIFTDLDKTTMDHVLRQLRKLPWDECEEYLLKCFMKVHKGKYGQIHLIALLTAGLSRYHDEFGVGVVDEVLEMIRVGLELNEYGMQQRRIAHMRYLGELYNFELADSSVIFETLYLLLVFGHGTAEQDVLDPPEDFFRIRMVITLLQTCGQYFGRGSSKRKLDRFLLYFQRYIICKGAVPLDIEFDLQDLFAALRPNMTRFTSIEEVDAALEVFEESERTASNDKSGNDKNGDGEKRSNSKAMLLNGKNNTNGMGENGKIHGGGGGDSESESSIIDPAEEESDPHGSGSEDDEDDAGRPAVSDEDETVRVRQKLADVDPLEEAEFEQRLKSVIQESLESRRQDMRTRPTSTMMIPMNLLEGSGKDQHGRGGDGESGDEAVDEECGDNKEVPVKVLVKRGNKQRTRQMLIPRDCSLIQSSKQQEAAELEEKQDIKRLVLEYNDREEEEMSGLGGQGQGFIQPGNIRGFHRGSTWEGSGGRGGRFYYKPHHHGGNEGYYSRKR
uniref:MIF4G domain-containing protein n=1 Tax=Kalanchoe fedtschenkoi TaxID=63787 RepID=A0A7N0V2R3_KALFE